MWSSTALPGASSQRRRRHRDVGPRAAPACLVGFARHRRRLPLLRRLARWVSIARLRTRAAGRVRTPAGGCRAAGAGGRRTPQSTVRAARTRRGFARTSARPRHGRPAGRRRAPSRTRTAGTRPRTRPGAARRDGSGSSSRPRSAPSSTACRVAIERGSEAGIAPRIAASSSAASGRGSLGERCQRPEG